MQYPKNKKILFLAGNKDCKKTCFQIFDKKCIKFLVNLSINIIKDHEAKKFPDLIAFAFWIRQKNLDKIKLNYQNNEIRFGQGLAFHITPSNIALNFAYSFVLSLLAGNSNIVRISSTKFKQNTIFFRILNNLFKKKIFKKIQDNSLFVQYDYDDEITRFFSMRADCRVIWGSDKTINKIKKIETNPICKEIIFPDRYSISILNTNNLKKSSNSVYHNTSKKLYADSLMFDQNACTSPHLVIWVGKRNKAVQEKFWKYLDNHIRKEKLFKSTEKKMFDKYTKICELSAERKEIKNSKKIGFINLSELKCIPDDIDKFRIGSGYFFEFHVKNLKNFNINFGKKVQTLSYFGFKKSELKNFLFSSKSLGIDRIVPVGRGLEFDQLWDGYDLIRSLSKIVNIQ